MKKVCLLTLLILIVGILTFTSSTFASVEYEWRLGTPWSRELQNESLQLFCDLVKLYSDGIMEIKFYPDGLLGTHDEIFHSVQEGSTEIGLFQAYSHLVPGGVINPGIWSIQDYNESAVAFDHSNGILFKLFSDIYSEVDLHLLFIGIEGPYGIGNNVRPIKTPDDFRNLKMRVAPAMGPLTTLQNMGEGTGMITATVPWGDLYNALERGVVDGCWSIWSSMVEERHYEVIKYYTALNYMWGTNQVVVNKEAWDDLPKDLQEAVEKAASIAELVEYEVHRRADAEFIKIIADSGCEIYYPTQEELDLFKEKANMPAIWEELNTPYLEKLYPGQNMTQKILDELDRINKNY